MSCLIDYRLAPEKNESLQIKQMINCRIIFSHIDFDGQVQATTIHHDIVMAAVPEIGSTVGLQEEGNVFFGKVENVIHHVSRGNEFEQGRWIQFCEIFLRAIEEE